MLVVSLRVASTSIAAAMALRQRFVPRVRSLALQNAGG
jgi:hypothetical protein